MAYLAWELLGLSGSGMDWRLADTVLSNSGVCTEMSHVRPHLTPPTIAQLQFMGLTGLKVTCAACDHVEIVHFSVLSLPDQTLFPVIARKRRFVCATCGSKASSVSPDWPD